MPRDCASCSATFAVELDRQLRANVPLTLISAWTNDQGQRISRNALARHRASHLALVVAPGRKPVSDDLLEAVRDIVHDRLSEGTAVPTVKDGVAAVKALDARRARAIDRDIVYKLTLALTGHVGPSAVRVIDPEVEALETGYRVLLDGGTGAEAQAAEDETRERLGLPAGELLEASNG